MSQEKTTPEVENNQQDLSELLQIRRDKLKALQESGNDPYQITTSDRDTLAKDITDNFDEIVKKAVKACHDRAVELGKKE